LEHYVADVVAHDQIAPDGASPEWTAKETMW